MERAAYSRCSLEIELQGKRIYLIRIVFSRGLGKERCSSPQGSKCIVKNALGLFPMYIFVDRVRILSGWSFDGDLKRK